ncbi:hypothetical protein [Streptomyces sp. NPDC058739]|uniref:hypothetical protein n=1 Tax=Streptomyces sp. NPDC058739 TaxID=3346618 RepID=UPI0036CD61C3
MPGTAAPAAAEPEGTRARPLWRWRTGSDLLTGRDRIAEIRLGEQHLTLALRADVDGQGDFGFDVLLPCPADPECAGQAWAPVYSVTDLHQALTGAMHHAPDIVCTVHGDSDPEGRADLEAQCEDAVRE